MQFKIHFQTKRDEHKNQPFLANYPFAIFIYIFFIFTLFVLSLVLRWVFFCVLRFCYFKLRPVPPSHNTNYLLKEERKEERKKNKLCTRMVHLNLRQLVVVVCCRINKYNEPIVAFRFVCFFKRQLEEQGAAIRYSDETIGNAKNNSLRNIETQ